MCEADHPTVMSHKCRLCGRRRAKRACPALRDSICAVCCGTKRRVEINCPPDCGYLISSKAHPPAAVQRQREKDFQFLFPLVRGLTGRQHEIMLHVQGFLGTDRPDEPAMVDDDVADATKALAETYETASRGIIYEHGAGRPSAERLSSELRTLIESQRGEGSHISDGDVAAVLRRIETGARGARSAVSYSGDDQEIAYLSLLRRTLSPQVAADDEKLKDEAAVRNETSPLIIPG